MIRCNNCGNENADGSNFCRFCGIMFSQAKRQEQPKNYEEEPLRPYAWKTDEFEIKDESPNKTTILEENQPTQNNLQNLNNFANQTNPIHPIQYQNAMSSGYRCPYCNTNALPISTNKVSNTGWAVFTILLITTFVLFWIGLLIQEEVRICPVCNMRVG